MIRRTICAVLLVAIGLSATPPAAASDAEPRVFVTVNAVLSADGKSLRGTATFRWQHQGPLPLETAALWLYPNRFQIPSPNLDEGMLRWVYPRDRGARGGMEIFAVRWQGKSLAPDAVAFHPLTVGKGPPFPDVTAEIALPEPVRSGETVQLTMSFVVNIPVRRGRFGRYDGVVSLAGGWFPVPYPAFSIENAQSPWDDLSVSATVALPPGRGAVLDDAVFPVKASAQQIAVHDLRTAGPVLIVMDRMEIAERTYPWGRAVYVHRSLPRKEPTWEASCRDAHGVPESLPQPGRFDYGARLLDTVGRTAEVIRAVAPSAELAERIVLVEIPAWDRLVQPGYGPVLVSDRLWRLLPVKDGLFFHDLALVRAVAPTLLFEKTLRREGPRLRYIAADLLGVFFSERYSQTVHKRLRSVEEIIGFARMFPTIDNLLYAPQIPFREVYFQFYEEPEPLRDEPWMFMNRLPRGKRVSAKWKERVGGSLVHDAVASMVSGEAGFSEVVSRSLRIVGYPPSEFWESWLGAYPVLNYRLAAVRDIPLGDGRIRHEADVVREGAIVREKVAVRFTDEANRYADVVWDAAERGTTLSWISRAPIDSVAVDPEGRLVESPRLTPDHPLRDNEQPLPWRPPMFTNLVVWGDLTTGEPYVEVGFWLRRKYDNTNIFSLDLAYTPLAWGGVFSYLRFFGKKRTLNARTWYVGPTVSAMRYGAVGTEGLHLSRDMQQSAFMGSAGLLAGRNTRTYSWDPMRGSSVSVSAKYGAGIAEDGSFRQMGKFSLRMGRLFSPAIHHTIALYGGASAVVGNPVAANLTSLSDRLMLRGFDSDETFGRIGLYAVAEWRHTLIEAASLPAPLYSWFDRFQGALFAACGTISKPSGPVDGLFTEERLFTEVGYGLRVHLLFLGVHQYLLGLDVAVPITPLSRTVEVTRSDGTVAEVSRLPYKIIFGITQTF